MIKPLKCLRIGIIQGFYADKIHVYKYNTLNTSLVLSALESDLFLQN